MIRKLIPVSLALFGLGAGIGAGLVLRPTPEMPAEMPTEGAHAATDGAHATTTPQAVDPEMLPDYVKLSNQFIVPVLEEGRVVSMVILSLSIEVTKGMTEDVYAREPKLRDGFLQAMFSHANAGGFRGSFTDGANLVLLRKALLEVAKSILGDVASDVLIVDIVRQDS